MSKRGIMMFIGATGAASRRRWRRCWATGTRTATATSSRSRTRSSSCTTQELHHHAARGRRGLRRLADRAQNTLRQAPDVILIGEVRERETMDYAISFAETGHLCLATCTPTAPTRRSTASSTSSRGAPRPALMDLSLNVRAFVAQRLIPPRRPRPRAGGGGDANSPLVSRPHLQGRRVGIKDIMKKSRELGMQTFDQSLFDLYEAGLITYEDALRNADSLNDLRARDQAARQGRRTATSSPASATWTLSGPAAEQQRDLAPGVDATMDGLSSARRAPPDRPRPTSSPNRSRLLEISFGAARRSSSESSCASTRPSAEVRGHGPGRRPCRRQTTSSGRTRGSRPLRDPAAISRTATTPASTPGTTCTISGPPDRTGGITSPGCRAAGAIRRTRETDMEDHALRLRDRDADEKTRRVRGVFDSVADPLRRDERPHVGRPAPAVEALRRRPRRRASRPARAGPRGRHRRPHALFRSQGRPGRNVVPRDINLAMLGAGARQSCSTAASRCPWPNATRKLPFPARTFDVVSIAFGLRNVTRKGSRLAEMRRVLRPAAPALVLEFSRVAAPARAVLRLVQLQRAAAHRPGGRRDEASYRYLAESILPPRPGNPRADDGTGGTMSNTRTSWRAWSPSTSAACEIRRTVNVAPAGALPACRSKEDHEPD